MRKFTEAEMRSYPTSLFVQAQRLHEWLDKIDFTYMFTGTFKYQKNDTHIEQVMKEFIKRCNCDYYGKYKAKYSNPSNPASAFNHNRLELFWCIESNASNEAHVHMLLVEPAGKLKTNHPVSMQSVLKKHWIALTYTTNIKVELIDSEKKNTTVGYLLKDYFKDTSRLHTEHINQHN